MIKLGLIGAGCIAESHIKVLENIDGFEIIGMYSKNLNEARSLYENFDIKIFPSPEALIESVDAIDITSTTKSHYDLIMHALKASKHVYIDNPIMNTLDEADRIIKIAEEANVTVQVGQSNRFNPAFISAKTYIWNPQYIEISRKNKFSLLNKDIHIVLGSMISDLDIVLSIFKTNIKKIKAKAHSVITEKQDIVNVRMEFDNGSVANLTANGISDEYEWKANIFQNGSSIFIDFLEYKNAITRLKNDLEKTNLFNFNHDELIIEKPEIKASNPVKDEMVSFYNSIITHSTSLLTLEKRFEALKVAHKILHKLDANNRFTSEISSYSSFYFGNN